VNVVAAALDDLASSSTGYTYGGHDTFVEKQLNNAEAVAKGRQGQNPTADTGQVTRFPSDTPARPLLSRYLNQALSGINMPGQCGASRALRER